MSMRISFGTVDSFEGWEKFPPYVASMILENGLKRVAEIGAGANPALNPEFAHGHQLEYLAIDEDESELRKAQGGTLTVYDVCEKACTFPGAPYDLIFGRMAAEHFRDAYTAY